MRIDIVTIFPSMFEGVLREGTLRIAQEKQLLEVQVHDLRDFTRDKHRQVDDEPYGGGFGMVMKPEPFYDAVVKVSSLPLDEARKAVRIIIPTPRGESFNQAKAEELSQEERLMLLCGRYEGIDERVHRFIATDEVSVGDYVLSGAEIAAMLIMDAVGRLLPGVLGKRESLAEESFTGGLLEYPQYTRPAEFRGWRVPEVLLSGNHAEIARWRREQRLEITEGVRPDLLARAELGEEERQSLANKEHKVP